MLIFRGLIQQPTLTITWRVLFIPANFKEMAILTSWIAFKEHQIKVKQNITSLSCFNLARENTGQSQVNITFFPSIDVCPE